MTDQHIQELINSFAQPNPEYLIVSQPIGAMVRYAKVWDEKDFHHLADVSPYKFYFLMNEEGQAVGAVLDMTGDLHWYVAPAYRKQGYLTRALKNVILPHLAQKRKTQRLTINRDDIGDGNFAASLAVARNCGFRVYGGLNNKTELKQGLRKFREVLITATPEGMDFEEMAELRKDMNEAVAKVWQIQATLEMKFGPSRYTRELFRTADLLDRYRMVRLEDALYDYQEMQEQRLRAKRH